MPSKRAQVAIGWTPAEDARRPSGLLEALEKERARIARQLHDVVGQQAAVLVLELGRLAKMSGSQNRELRRELLRLEELAKDIARETRETSHELHPAVLSHLGLEVALRGFCRAIDERDGISVNFESSGNLENLPVVLSSSLYLIAQEALRNISQHAAADRVAVRLEESSGVVGLSVQDNGRGFSMNDDGRRWGVGLLAMAERCELAGGRFELEAKKGKGVRVSARIPLEGWNGTTKGNSGG